MRIDAHQHFWRYEPASMAWIGPGMEVLARDCLPAEVAPQLEQAGMVAAIAVQSLEQEADTDFLMTQAARHRWIAGVVGWLDLQADDCAARIQYWQSRGPLVGLRYLLQDLSAPQARLDDPAFQRGLRQLQQRQLVYDLLLQGSQLSLAPAFCARHDQHHLVLDHLGKPAISGRRADWEHWYGCMRQLAAMPHVAVKCSGLLTLAAGQSPDAADRHGLHRYLDTVLELFGPRRLLFGSDWPVCLLASSHAELHRQLAQWSRQLSASEQAALYGGNAQTIYRHGLLLADQVPAAASAIH